MSERPSYFNEPIVMNGYTFYKNEHDRVYVPEEKNAFNKFLDAIFKKIAKPTKEQAKNFELIRQYPFLLPKNRWDKGYSLDTNFEYTELTWMPEGWRKAFGNYMLKELKDALGDYIYEYMVTDIKEKYGTLRWYDFGAPEEAHKVISKFERLSANTCIVCGKNATHVTEGYILPLCDTCYEEKEKK